MTKTPTLTLVLAVALAGLAGCAARPEHNPDASLQAMMQASFRSEGIAGIERLAQDADQLACSTGQAPGESEAAQIRQTALKTIQPPSDGHYLGDWQQGEKLAQDGRGLTWTDKSAEPQTNGAGCYNCHQLTDAEVSYGTIGPSLRHYARTHGVANPADPKSQAMVVYTWGKINNSWAYSACSHMPRFGYHGMLGQAQIQHLMALLLDPASPVNAP